MTRIRDSHWICVIPDQPGRINRSGKPCVVGCADATVDTNIVVVPHPDPPAFVAAARDAGVLVAAVGPRTVRMVTHLDVSRADAERAAAVLGGL